MTAFINNDRDAYGVEPICRFLPITPSTYHERVAQREDSTCLSAEEQRDVALKLETVARMDDAQRRLRPIFSSPKLASEAALSPLTEINRCPRLEIAKALLSVALWGIVPVCRAWRDWPKRA